MRRLALLTGALCAALATPAFAHSGNPNYESLVTRVDGAPGVRAEMLNGDDRVLVINGGKRTVVVDGYDGEPYARLRPDGTVEVNQNSPARWLNDDRFGQVDVPATASKDAEPAWKVVGRNGRFEFHDHRAHWMSKGTPPQVSDTAERTRIFDWTVPMHVGATAAAVRGTLWWRGSGGGAPVAAFAGLGVFALLGLMLVVVVRTRRRRPAAEPGTGVAGEAW
jgi:hypothetical protein